MTRLKHTVVAFFIAGAGSLNGQTDTIRFSWPDPPFDTSKPINGTFCEYRNTLSANHFHSGVDIGEPDGFPIYPSLNGVVHSFSTTDGSNNFVRIRSLVGGLWKHISYVHINPAPGLALGDSVHAQQTILGTIIPGLGHVHFTERELVGSPSTQGVEINAIRAGGGLTPYDDSFSPVIDRSKILFREYSTFSFMPSSSLYGRVEFIAKIDERNAPGGVGTTQTNNGTYLAGFRVLASDSATVISEQPDAGVRFRFDRKPSDNYTDSLFVPPPYSSTSAHYYVLTSGSGAQSILNTRTAPRGFFDTGQVPEGQYLLQIFTADTRANTDTALIPITVTHADFVPPPAPTLTSVRVDSLGALHARWASNSEPDLRGYRLHYHNGSAWAVAADEFQLTTTSVSFASPPAFLPASSQFNSVQFSLTAVDTSTPPNESARSDAYRAGYPWFTVAESTSVAWRRGLPILIVDGFDRFGGSGSWPLPTHNFVSLLAGHLPPLTPVSSCANEAVTSGLIDLKSYYAVYWILGDESTADHTFTSAEQQKVKEYLEGGGRLFVSGAEIGWDLGRLHGASETGDLTFYQNYLKAAYVFDGNTSMSSAQGVAGTLFDGISVSFGQTYQEDYPDDIDPVGGASPVLTYNASRTSGPRIAGIAYAGTFGSSSIPGKLVYLAFPFETIGSSTQRQALLDRVSSFFDIPTSVSSEPGTVPRAFELSQNYPNPFNPTTSMIVHVPSAGRVTVQVFDLLGQEIVRVLDGEKEAGSYQVVWDAFSFPSGTYFAVARYGSSVQVRKILLVR